jgi:hypothetical protein
LGEKRKLGRPECLGFKGFLGFLRNGAQLGKVVTVVKIVVRVLAVRLQLEARHWGQEIIKKSRKCIKKSDFTSKIRKASP